MEEKRPMQNVKFRSMADLLAFVPEEELVLLEELRALVKECVPEAKERLSFNVPFYRRHTDICFIWPASVFWGSRKTYDGVRFGFAQGHLLVDETGYLKKEERKQIFWRDLVRITVQDREMIRSLLYQAVLVDDERAKTKKAPRPKR